MKVKAFYIVLILLAVAGIYKYSGASENTVKIDSAQDRNYGLQNNEDYVEEHSEVKAAATNTTVFSITSFFDYIRESYSEYEFGIEEASFNWKNSNRDSAVAGKEIKAVVASGDYQIQEDCRDYLLNAGFTVHNENASGSDAGDSLQGFQSGRLVCLIETKSIGEVETVSYRVSCGEL